VDRRLDRDVALKVMHPHLAEGGAGADFVARFRREARAAARLTHPGLVGVYDQGLDGETSYLTMEYVDGVNLRRHLAERGSLSVGETLRVAEQVLDALAAAHRAGLVHRDIKPENVLMAADGRVKLADFGLARAVTEVTSTTTGTVFGTVAYLAPELVVRGESDVRTDVYAAGVLLYEMLTGRQPFTGETPIQIAFQHVNSDVPAPSDTAAWIPVEIDELVAALAARDPEDRPTDASAALALLRRTREALDPTTLDRRTDVAPTVVLPADTDDSEAGASEPDAPEDGDEDAAVDTDATTRIDALHAGRTVALPIGLGEHGAGNGAVVATIDAPPRRSRRRLVAWIAAAVLLVAAVAGGSWWYATEGPGAFTTVPEIAGLAQADAEAALDEAGLDHTAQDGFSDEIAVGSVISSDPGDGESVRKDGSVTLTVSVGPDVVDLPAGLVTMMQDDAAAALTAADLVAGYEPLDTRADWDDTATIGSVLRVVDEDGNDIPEGTRVPRGSTVYLVLSDGPAPVTVISVVGATLEDATEELGKSGLQVTSEEVFSDTVAAGAVVAQDPGSNAEAHRGDTVHLQVSKGPELIEVPSVFGNSYDDAKATLEGLGFVVVRENVFASPTGRVLSQSVSAGEKIKRGTQITLKVV
jgi:serine/threonine-protein kinase